MSRELTQWLAETGHGDIVERHPLSGGDICQTELIRTSTGEDLCIKQEPSAPDHFFEAEATGLRAIAATDCIRVPQVYTVTHSFIALEYIEPSGTGGHYWERLGEQLAALHAQPVPGFGFTGDNFCGRTPQPNPHTQDGYRFFADYRLRYQAGMALEYGRLSEAEVEAIERLCERLPSLIPVQPPSLIHGDLWVGNIHSDPDGNPVLIDPAAHWGWAEAELAMTRLFGGFHPRFYQAYLAHRPLAPDWESRVPLYNLYHLLNHLNLFGSSYHPQIVSVLNRYTQV
ncbi:fructosamine kinase family protein [Marinimicrobium alkaliphilum]|uniref:fructosamine kinase family protein n=1 Tax=Marinimicrobium alkaliphilum TaxID=2202654 RepID=UPI001300A779|nr:fructosamine kinase family protein [Marinimicrobium alkaliphilum]